MSQKNKQTALKKVLQKYLQNEATLAEQEVVNHWYNNLGSADLSTPILDDELRRADLSANIKQHLIKRSLNKKQHKYLFIKYAAALFLIVSIGIIGRNYLSSPSKQKSEVIFTSTDQAAKQITLTDGSKVLLNVGSQLLVSKNFGNSTREVTLSGEAFFEVAKDKAHPFIIVSSGLKTQVLGTSFNINAYNGMDYIKVSVLTGKVQVSKNNSVLALGLTKGHVLSYHKTTGKVLRKIENSDFIASWRSGKLYIDNATLGEIAIQLQRYYHLKVIFEPKSDTGKRYTIRFNREAANQVMAILSKLTKRKFIYQTNQIIIK